MKIVGLPYEPQPQLRRRRKTRWRMKTTWGGPTVLPLSLSLSISLSLTLPLSVAIPVPRCACGGAARRRGPAAGMRGKSKGVKSMGATGKMFEGTSYDFAESCAVATAPLIWLLFRSAAGSTCRTSARICGRNGSGAKWRGASQACRCCCCLFV